MGSVNLPNNFYQFSFFGIFHLNAIPDPYHNRLFLFFLWYPSLKCFQWKHCCFPFQTLTFQSPSDRICLCLSIYLSITIRIHLHFFFFSYSWIGLLGGNFERSIKIEKYRKLLCLQITWIDGSGNVLTAGVEYIKEPSPDSRLSTAKSILKLKSNKALHNKTIHCQAQNSADKTYRSASIRLEVSVHSYRKRIIRINPYTFHQRLAFRQFEVCYDKVKDMKLTLGERGAKWNLIPNIFG